mgnify:CR=1 FL=1
MRNNDDLPANAKKAFSGELFDVWQWDQKMYDGSTKTFERISRADAVVVIAIVNDKIMILNQEQPDYAKPYISMPGGRVEDGEDPLESAKRELLEETGYESSDWEFLRKDQPMHKINCQIHIFIARNCKKTGEQNLDSGEKIEVKWYDFDQFLSLANDDDKFHYRTLVTYLFRARLDENKMKELKERLF